MHKAIDAGDYKKAIHHKIVANVAIDEMVGKQDGGMIHCRMS